MLCLLPQSKSPHCTFQCHPPTRCRIFLGLPDRAARAAILRVVLEGERLAPDVDVARLAEQTEGYSGSDLRQLCVQAAMRPVRALLEEDSKAAEAVAAEEAAEAAEAEAAEAEAAEAEAAEAEAANAEAAEPTGQGSVEGQGSAASAAASPRTASLAGSAEGALLAELAEMEEEMGRDSVSTGSAAEQQRAAAGAAPRAGQAGAWAGSAAGSPLQLVPRLDSLLRQAERIADVPRNPKTDLRPISMQARGRAWGFHPTSPRMCCCCVLLPGAAA